MRPVPLSFAVATPVVAALVWIVPQGALAQAHACSIAPARLCHAASAAPSPLRHLARARIYRHVAYRHVAYRNVARYGRAYHIPRFDQDEAEAEVHTAYPYRTGIFAPWPDFYGTPYYPPY